MGFFVATPTAMRKVALSGGAPVTVCTTGNFAGATWADNDTIYFVSDMPGGVLSVPAAGGPPTGVVKIDAANGERILKFPHALPGGRAVLFTAASADAESFDDANIAVVSIESGKRKTPRRGWHVPALFDVRASCLRSERLAVRRAFRSRPARSDGAALHRSGGRVHEPEHRRGELRCRCRR